MRDGQRICSKAWCTRLQPFRKRTNNFGSPPGDFTIDIYERSNVPKWKFTRPIMRSIMSLLARKLMDARGGKASPYASQVIIIEFVNLVSGTIDRIRRVGGNLVEEKKGRYPSKVDRRTRNFITESMSGHLGTLLLRYIFLIIIDTNRFWIRPDIFYLERNCWQYI